MNNIKEKVSYLKGLAEGMKISDTTNEGKLLLAMLDVLDDIAFEVDGTEEYFDILDEKMYEVDERVKCLEKIVYDDDCECDDCDCDDCGCKHDDEDLEYITIECPHCHKQTSFDVDLFDEETDFVECPHCNEKIQISYEDDCGCDDCDCE